MQGRLALRGGVLYVGRHGTTAHVRPYDLDGRALNEGISFRAPDGTACTLNGLDVDEDRGLWVADGLTERLRRFTLFGREVASFQGVNEGARDLRGALTGLSDLALVQDAKEESAARLLVARSGWRRHAVQMFDLDGTWLQSLRSEGDPRARFRGVRAVGARGRRICVCEAGQPRVQVFLDGEFHFLFTSTRGNGRPFEPAAAAPLEDGRMVLACAGPDSALLLFDGAGRLLRVLAEAGPGEGQVSEPNDVVVEPGELDRQVRVVVVDRDGDRVQVFSLDGRCFGELTDLPGQALY